MNDIFKKKENIWYERVLLCRNSISFLHKEMVIHIKKHTDFEGFEKKNKSKKPQEVDIDNLDEVVDNFKLYVSKNNELCNRMERERQVLRELAIEGLQHNYLND